MRRYLLWFLALFLFIFPAVALADSYYTVRSGDTLWGLANRFEQFTVNQLKKHNGLSGDTLYVGQRLVLPGVNGYTVVRGDTLYWLSKKYGVSVYRLQKMNGFPQYIYVGQLLYVPGSRPTSNEKPTTGNYNEDLYWLSRIISAEARGESKAGQIAVGAVILNRVDHPNFPNSVKAVIFQYTGSIPQFSPVQDGSIYLQPTSAALDSAIRALAGEDPSRGALYFYNPHLTSWNNWIRTRPVTTVIGNHIFAR